MSTDVWIRDENLTTVWHQELVQDPKNHDVINWGIRKISAKCHNHELMNRNANLNFDWYHELLMSADVWRMDENLTTVWHQELVKNHMNHDVINWDVKRMSTEYHNYELINHDWNLNFECYQELLMSTDVWRMDENLTTVWHQVSVKNHMNHDVINFDVCKMSAKYHNYELMNHDRNLNFKWYRVRIIMQES